MAYTELTETDQKNPQPSNEHSRLRSLAYHLKTLDESLTDSDYMRNTQKLERMISTTAKALNKKLADENMLKHQYNNLSIDRHPTSNSQT